MVVSVTPLPIGTAMRIQVSPPEGATLWNVLRNTTGNFPSYADPASTLVSQTSETVVCDALGLANGKTYFYSAFYWDGTAWSAPDAAVSGVPAATYIDFSTDALTLLRDRLYDGIQNEVAAGRLVAGENSPNGVIAVQTAPPVYENTSWPVVVVHLASESPAQHGIGESIGVDLFGANNQWADTEGWIANTRITVTAWALNPDVRIALRKALRRLVIGNLQVFNAAGLREIEFAQQDEEDLSMGMYPSPIYWSTGTFTCFSPVAVGGQLEPVTDITIDIDVVNFEFTETLSNAGTMQ